MGGVQPPQRTRFLLLHPFFLAGYRKENLDLFPLDR